MKRECTSQMNKDDEQEQGTRLIDLEIKCPLSSAAAASSKQQILINFSLPAKNRSQHDPPSNRPKHQTAAAAPLPPNHDTPNINLLQALGLLIHLQRWLPHQRKDKTRRQKRCQRRFRNDTQRRVHMQWHRNKTPTRGGLSIGTE